MNDGKACHDLRIDQEFESIIPPLDEEEFQYLKASILHDKEIYHPIVVWNGIVIDGHHRYKILKENPDLKYRIDERNFANRHEAISWICLNQLGRRNLSVLQRISLTGRRYQAEKDAHGAWERFQNKKFPSPNNLDLEDANSRTAYRIAKEMGVSHATVENAEKFVEGMDAAEEVLPGISREIISGKIRPTQKAVAAIATAPYHERREMAEKLRVPRKLTAEQKAERERKRAFNRSIDMLYAGHIQDDKPKPMAKDMLSSLSADVGLAISNISRYFRNYPDMLTEDTLQKEVMEILSKLKEYIEKVEDYINDRNNI